MSNIQFGGVVQPAPCGCTVEGIGTLPDPWRVVHCRRHSSAHCERCGHDWQPRGGEIRICPKCKSPYWNQPKNGAVEEAPPADRSEGAKAPRR